MADEADDLDAFFARKKKDKKKKKTVSLDDIGQQLDRKARIQEVNDGQSLSPLAEQEDKLASEEQGGKVQQNSAGGDEDSEWLDYSAKPAIPEVSFKEYQELSDEETDKGEDNGRTPDTTKTWNVAGEVLTIVEPVPMPVAEAKPAIYQPPGQARRSVTSGGGPLDISSSEMFPSIGDADELEKKERDKAEARKRSAIAASAAAAAPTTTIDHTNTVEASPEPTVPAAKTKWTPVDVPIGTQQETIIPRYDARHGGRTGGGGGMRDRQSDMGGGWERSGSGAPPGEESPASTEMNWRSEKPRAAAPPAHPTAPASSSQPSTTAYRPRVMSGGGSGAGGGFDSLRTGGMRDRQSDMGAAAAAASTTNDDNNWRRGAAKTPSANSPQHQPTIASTPISQESSSPAPEKYIPPSMRSRMT